MRLIRWNKGKWHGTNHYTLTTYCGRNIPVEKINEDAEVCNCIKKENVPGGLHALCGKCFDV